MIYLDNNSTTLLDPRVREAMLPLLGAYPCNPSSLHKYGREGNASLVWALTTLARYFKVKESEIVFTSGATEALNLLIQGFKRQGHIVTSSLEHSSVLEPLRRLEKRGWKVTYLDPEPGQGALLPHQVEEALGEESVLLVLMAANNETGVKTAIDAMAHIAERRGVAFLVDGVALLGKEPFFLSPGITAACFSGHKFHGPLGSGFALVRSSFPFDPLIVGGGQQRGRRGGTENVPALVGMAKAVELLQEELPASQHAVERLRNRLEEGIRQHLPSCMIVGEGQERVCNTSNLCFPGREGENLVIQLDRLGVAVSHGSACSSGGQLPSHVLLHMGLAPSLVRSSLRFSLSRFTTEEEIDRAIKMISHLV